MLLVALLIAVVESEKIKIINANFSKNNQGFKFQRDAFRGTSNGKYAKGRVLKNMSSLTVKLGGVDNNKIRGSSGGWGRDFNLPKAGNVQLVFDLRMSLTPPFGKGDDLDALEGEALVEPGEVGLVAREAVEGLDHDHLGRAAGDVGEELREARPSREAGARPRAVVVATGDRQSEAFGVLRTKRKLIVDGSLALQLR